jgi:hypothetical protein
MKASQFMQLRRINALVRKYQVRWEFCLDKKTHSYYWLEKFAQRP